MWTIAISRFSTLGQKRNDQQEHHCLWYDGTAVDAANFYAATFPDSAVGTVLRAPGDYPDGKQGDVLTVEFTVVGIPCLGLNGGPQFKHNEAFSFQIATDGCRPGMRTFCLHPPTALTPVHPSPAPRISRTPRPRRRRSSARRVTPSA